MRSKPQNFQMVSGDDEIIEARVFIASSGVPKDLTGLSSATWALAEKGTTRAKLTKTLAGGGIFVTDAVNGIVQITLAQSDTADLEGEYDQELQIVDAANKKSTVFQGVVTVVRDIIA